MYGTLQVLCGRPNPDSAGVDALYLFRGTPAAAPIREIVADPGVILPGPPDLPPGRPFHLRVLHFNDLHGYLADVSEHTIRPVFSRLAGYMARARESCVGRPDVGVLAFAGGDDLVETAFSELVGHRPADFRCHPAYRLYSAAGVDAGAVGNHDLDWGLGMLSLAARQDAVFPLLSANLVPAAGAATAGIYPAALFVVKGLRVGVIGLTTPAEIKHLLPGEFAIADPVVALRHLLPALRPQCDVVIVLSHLGHSLASTSAVTADAGDVELARAVRRGAAHLIIGAHTHTALNASALEAANCINGIPIVQAGAKGHFLGETLIVVGREGVAVGHVRLHAAANLPEDIAFETTHVQPLARQVQGLLRRPVGQAAAHPDLATACVRQAFAGSENALVNFITDALAARCRAAGLGVDFALVDASAITQGLPTGPLTFGDLFRMTPYGDSIVLYRLSPAQVQALLADNAQRVGGPPEAVETRGFAHFSREVRYGIALAAGLAPRVVAATVNGVELAAMAASRDEPLTVATSSFVRQLASRWEQQAAAEGTALFDLHALPAVQTGLALRAELVAYVRAHGGVTEAAGLVRDGRLLTTWARNST